MNKIFPLSNGRMKKRSKNRRLERLPKQYRDDVEVGLTFVAEQLKKRRISKDMTQEGLAELLNVEPTTIQSIEQMRGRPSLELLLAMVKVLEMKITLK